MYSLLKAKRDDNVRLLDNCDSHKRNQNKILKEKKRLKLLKLLQLTGNGKHCLSKYDYDGNITFREQ